MGRIKKITNRNLLNESYEGDIYPVTAIKAVYDEKSEELNHILDRNTVVNISTNYNDKHIAEVLTKKDCIAKVPEESRVLGFQGKYLSNDGWYSIAFIGDKISDWNDIEKWTTFPLDIEEETNKINEAISSKANTKDVQLAIKDLEEKIGDRTIIEGNVTNNPDEEDISTRNIEGKKVLSFNDRAYNPLSFSGKGYKILRKNIVGNKNILTSSMVNQSNTIYEIRYDYDLNNESIDILDGSVLYFNGGSFRNGTINNAIINYCGNDKIFSNVNFDKLYSLQDVRPEWFGAKGDGITDDTDAIRTAFFICNYNYTNNGKDGYRVLCNPKKYYKLSGNINYYNGENYDIILNCVGNTFPITGGNSSNHNITFMLTKNVSMFLNAKIQGKLSNCKIITQEIPNEDCYIFNHCFCSALDFCYNTVDRVDAFFYNSSINEVTRIYNNRIKSTYFAKVDSLESTIGFIDSYIYNNFITGNTSNGIDNYCFGWKQYNAATVRNNFIDYFKCIYAPQLGYCFQTVLSIGNQYQVFKYFYTTSSMYKDAELKELCNGININSVGDSFNWIAPESLPFLKSLKPYYFKDGVYSVTELKHINTVREVAPFIFCSTSSNNIRIANAQIEGNVNEFILYKISMPSIKNAQLHLDYVRLASFSNINSFIIENIPNYYPYFNSLEDLDQYIDIEGFDILNALPEIKSYGQWCNYPIGYKVKVGTKIYKLVGKKTQNTIKFEWDLISNYIRIEDSTSGSYQSRPINVKVGFSYFCTDKQTSEGGSNGIMLYYKGNDVWVDALGRTIS